MRSPVRRMGKGIVGYRTPSLFDLMYPLRFVERPKPPQMATVSDSEPRTAAKAGRA